MPTLNKYKHDPGYYILAWTPETGNITYNIRSAGTPIVEEYGLEDGADISWDTINSLKALGLIYTKESGTIAVDEFEPDPDHVSETSLSQDEAEDLLAVIRKHRDVSRGTLEEICEILGIEPPGTEVGRLEPLLENRLEEVIEQGDLPTETTLGESVTSIATVEDIRDETESGRVGISLLLLGMPAGSDDPQLVIHWAFVCRAHGLEGWEISFGDEQSCEQTGELLQQQGKLLPMVAGALYDAGIEPVNPPDPPMPPFVTFDDLGVNSAE